jgi:signal transduction histidine kinase
MCLQFTASAQVISPFVNHLTMADGLLDGVNYYITRDSKGFVWISSLNGLNRYDGSEVRQYTAGIGSEEVKGQYVQSKMFEDEEGNLYFTTYAGGINCYQRATDTFEAWPLPDSGDIPVTGYHAFHLGKDKQLWVLVNNKNVYHFDIETHKYTHRYDVPVETYFCHLATDAAGEPLFSVSNDDHGRLTLTHFTEGDTSQLTRILSFNGTPLKISRLRPDGDSLVWFTDRRSLYAYHIKEDRVIRHFVYNASGPLTEDALEFYNRDTLVLSTGSAGLYFFDCRRNQVVSKVLPTNGSTSNRLSSGTVCAVNVLNDGSVWCNICTKGLDFFHPGKTKFTVVNMPESLAGKGGSLAITSLLEVGDEIWCSTKFQGILVFDRQGNFKRQYHANSPPALRLPSNTVRLLFMDRKKRIWILTNRGMSVFDGRMKLVRPDEILSICQLDDGNLVVGPRSGGLELLVQAPGGSFTSSPVENIDKKSHYVRLWMDNYGRLFGNRNLIVVDVISVRDGFKIRQNIPLSGEVEFLQEARADKIWIGSSQGLSVFNASLDTASQHRFTRQNGLPSNVVYALQQVGNAIWISTDAGLSRFDLLKKTFTNYTTADGLPSNIIEIGCLLLASDGQLWIGTTDGIAMVNPARIAEYRIPALTAITNIRINDVVPGDLVCSRTGARNVSEIKFLKLKPDENTLSFSIAALEYSNPGASKFSYFMEGLDDDWIDAGNNNFIRYSKIPPGHYFFRYRASNSEQTWGPVKMLEIFVEPPFYQTWPFYTLIGLVMAMLFWGVMWYRQRKRMEKERLAAEQRAALEAERQRIARDMHDDLGSSLSALSLMTQIALSRKNGDLRTDMEKINKSALEIGGKIREVIWMVSASNDSLSSLVSYLFSYTTKLSKDTDIECDISIPENLPEIRLGSEVRRNLYLCFKEAVNNALKYANATTLTIDIAFVKNTLRITVSDDGNGFDPTLIHSSSGNGLRNMQERMRQIGGSSDIVTGPAGTTISFIVSMDKMIEVRSGVGNGDLRN